jgi:hypothetical protein
MEVWLLYVATPNKTVFNARISVFLTDRPGRTPWEALGVLAGIIKKDTYRTRGSVGFTIVLRWA